MRKVEEDYLAFDGTPPLVSKISSPLLSSFLFLSSRNACSTSAALIGPSFGKEPRTRMVEQGASLMRASFLVVVLNARGSPLPLHRVDGE